MGLYKLNNTNITPEYRKKILDKSIILIKNIINKLKRSSDDESIRKVLNHPGNISIGSKNLYFRYDYKSFINGKNKKSGYSNHIVIADFQDINRDLQNNLSSQIANKLFISSYTNRKTMEIPNMIKKEFNIEISKITDHFKLIAEAVPGSFGYFLSVNLCLEEI